MPITHIHTLTPHTHHCLEGEKEAGTFTDVKNKALCFDPAFSYMSAADLQRSLKRDCHSAVKELKGQLLTNISLPRVY